MKSSDELFDQLKLTLREEAMSDLIHRMRGQGVPPPRTRAPRAAKDAPKPFKKAAPKPAKRTLRSPEMIEQLSKDLVAYVKKNPESTMKEIKTGLGATTADLQFPMRKLKETKSFRTKGAGANMRYSLKV